MDFLRTQQQLTHKRPATVCFWPSELITPYSSEKSVPNSGRAAATRESKIYATCYFFPLLPLHGGRFLSQLVEESTVDREVISLTHLASTSR